MRHVFRGSLVGVCAAGAMFGLMGGVGIAQASTTQASATQASATQAGLMSVVSPALASKHESSVSFASPMTDPPGACEEYEYGDWRVGPDGYLYQCEYVDGEGYYWLPV